MLRAGRSRARWTGEAVAPAVGRLFGCFASCDLILLGHLLVMRALLALAEVSAASGAAARRVELCGAILVLGCVIGRGTALPARARSLVYRLVVVGAVIATYLMMRDALPLVQPGNLDARLDELDVAFWGARPTVWLEPLMTPSVVEYLAFFYFSYFLLCGVWVVVAVGPAASAETSREFAIGTSVVYGLGQLGYVLVPGFGPTRHLEHLYRGPLEGGLFWEVVLWTVSAGSALKDIFPSLHTAAPVWFALFAARRARRTGAIAWRAAAVLSAVFAAHIVVSTVALRWHWCVDVLAGLALAVAAGLLAPRLSAWEDRLRARAGLAPAWRFD